MESSGAELSLSTSLLTARFAAPGISAPKPLPKPRLRISIAHLRYSRGAVVPAARHLVSISDSPDHQLAFLRASSWAIISRARSRYACEPFDVGSYTVTGRPWLGDSDTRTLRGITVR